MDYRITGLDPKPFEHLFALDDAGLARHRAVRRIVAEKPGAPCRVSLEDAEPGEEVLLLNHEHLAVDSPYRASHAVYVRRAARAAWDRVNEVPPALASRLLSVRAFDGAGFMAGADITEGAGLPALVAKLFADPRAAFLHAHAARAGCFLARIDRA
ncbi:MAG TPA: DUF1203 domain-containing protein [Usitatibacteraceae bacterium]|jgi:hypothetical protein|nr:DUF1203 domain-containing protein [Usitatibacteraceae bacterium]HQY47885.1 DUF1203 domain-containing protein [Usitatibacteraceae bacterium]HRA24541.1 DUF1203 domain-containing protein [Usitatibacteraceae bacterium]